MPSAEKTRLTSSENIDLHHNMKVKKPMNEKLLIRVFIVGWRCILGRLLGETHTQGKFSHCCYVLFDLSGTEIRDHIMSLTPLSTPS